MAPASQDEREFPAADKMSLWSEESFDALPAVRSPTGQNPRIAAIGSRDHAALRLHQPDNLQSITMLQIEYTLST